MQNFGELAIWKRSHQLVLQIYAVTQRLPKEETFGLVLNLRRSAIAVATRIAEGAGKASDEEFAGELKKARAVGYELEYLLLLSRDLGFLDAAKHDELAREVIEVRKMTSGLLKRLMACQRASTPGRTLPSRNSSEAPPPVEMWVILSAKPDL